MDDLYELLIDSDPRAVAAARADLLRRQGGAGALLAGAGGRRMAPLAQGLMQRQDAGEGQIADALGQRLRMAMQQAQADRAHQFDVRRQDETERHNRSMESRPPSFPVIYGGGGEALRIDPRDPNAPAVPVLGPGGAPVKKPAGGAHGAGMGGLTMPDVVERKRKMLSDGQVKILAQYDNGIAMLQDIAAKKGQVDTGPVASRRNALAGKFGLDDPQVSAFRAMVGDQLASYIRGISGAAASDRERAFLMQNIPKLEDSDETFNAKLKVVSERLARLREIELDLFSKQGKDTAPFNEEDAPAAAAAATPRRRRYNPSTGALE